MAKDLEKLKEVMYPALIGLQGVYSIRENVIL